MQDLMKQWMDLSKSITDSLQQMTQNNITAMSELTQSAVGSYQLSEFMKNVTATGKGLEAAQRGVVNEFLQGQLKTINLTANANALKELGEINASAMNRLVESQMEIVNSYLESSTKHMDNLKQAQSMEDLLGAQSALFTELQSKMKTNTQETLDVLNEVKSAVGAWTEKTLKESVAK